MCYLGNTVYVIMHIPKDVAYHITSCHITTHHIVDLKQQNRLKDGTDKIKLKVKMQSVSDDDVQKRLLEKATL